MDALGMIETKGLVGAVEALDSMLKSADVTLLDRVFVGGGIVTVTIQGDVGAVKSAVDAGAAAVRQLDAESLLAEHVIPRPEAQLDGIVITHIVENAPSPYDPDPDPNPSPDNGNGSQEGPEESLETSVDPEPAAEEPAADEPTEQPEEEAQPEPEEPVETPVEEEPAVEENSTETDPQPVEEEVMQLEMEVEAEPVQSETTAEAEASEALSDTEIDTESVQSAEEAASEDASESLAEIPAITDREGIDAVIASHGVDALDDALAGFKVSELRKIARGYNGFGLSGRNISKANKKMLIQAFKDYYK